MFNSKEYNIPEREYQNTFGNCYNITNRFK